MPRNGSTGLTGSARTAANKHGFLAGALNAAVRARYIFANPCDGNRLRRDEPAEMVFLAHEEFGLLQRTSSKRSLIVSPVSASAAKRGRNPAVKRIPATHI